MVPSVVTKLLCMAAAFVLNRYCKSTARRLVLSRIEFNDTGHVIEGEIKLARLNPNQSVTFTAEPLDRHKNPANIESGSAKWSVSDESVGSISVNPDNELQATFTSSGNFGQTFVTVDADGRAGEGEKPVQGVGTVIVAPEDVASFDLKESEPVDA